MIDPAEVVSIHPYFKIHPGKLEEVKALLPEFVAKVQGEEKNLCYDFTLNGDALFCRESYVGAEGALAHVENVGPELERILAMCDLERLELHGSAKELDKLREPFAQLNPVFFEFEVGVTR